jgi:Fe-S cluster assembly iron-binding protein IscA
LALDEPKETDQVFTINDYRYIIDQALMDKAVDINIDYVDTPSQQGLFVTSAKPVADGAAGSSCGSCSC